MLKTNNLRVKQTLRRNADGSLEPVGYEVQQEVVHEDSRSEWVSLEVVFEVEGEGEEK